MDFIPNITATEVIKKDLSEELILEIFILVLLGNVIKTGRKILIS